MTAPVWPRSFLGGVADAAGTHALLRDRRGRMIALRLDDGQLLWRSEVPLQPLLVEGDSAWGLAVAPPRVTRWALAGPQAGQMVCASAPLPWPAWASAADPARVEVALEVAGLDADLGLRWQLRQRYAGGAPPQSGVAREASSGACRIDASTGALGAATPWPARPADAVGADEALDPKVLAQSHVGARRYRLVAHDVGGVLRTSLIAHDAEERLLWERVLDEAPRRSPPALRR